MSEFKYACPVCGQHIKCDSSQAGSVMDCPTCFQKIVVPQPPANADPKFILTGSKFVEKKIPDTLAKAAAGSPAPPEKGFPVAIVAAMLAVVLAAGAVVFVFRGKIFTTEKPPSPPPHKMAGGTNAPPKPKIVAPPANDANWMLALGTSTIPDAPAAGRIHSQDFIVERASFSTNGTLTLRAGTRGQIELGLFVNFGGAQAESLSGQTLNVTTNADKAAKISLRWKDAGGAVQKANFDNGYAMRLEFGALANGRLPGKIYLCTPDAEKSYLMGSFNADARKPKPKPPQPPK